jgi:hypothetical protein
MKTIRVNSVANLFHDESKGWRRKRQKGSWEWGMGNGEWGMGNGEWGMGIIDSESAT